MTATEAGESVQSTETKRTPLPRWQLLIVFLIQLAEPITATVIFPFAPEFIRRTGITGGDETKTGYYAGLIESAFFLAECLSVFHWGRLSDRVGRKPVLLLGPLGLTFAMLGFGASSSFWSLVLFRCAQGVFNGNIGVSKTVMGELTDSTNIGEAFALMPLIWGLGVTVGPVIGGLLVHPADTWPNTFGRIALFRDHPYFLPCAVAGLFSFAICLLTLIGLQETHPSTIARKKSKCSRPTQETSLISSSTNADYGSVATAATDDAVSDSIPSQPPSMREVLGTQFLRVLMNYTFISFVETSYDALIPLMYSTSIPVGGLGFSPFQIGQILSIWGLTNAIVQTVFTGRLLRVFGARRMFIVSIGFMFVGILAFSFESYFARLAGRVDGRVVTLILIQLTCNLMVFVAFAAVHVLVVQSATSRAALGSTNGVAQMAGSGIRGLAPYFASSMFSISLESQIAGGFLVYIIILVLTLVLLWLAFKIPKRFKSADN
ncbi:MFS general substrate transporter [Guyanagaster necrorhizus]|uniref:MFS general substrate transporter n=1 Tax=Guyanagaster necrorhizus TaxID=856835 RepID=A0A9P7VQ33_9AGAR|nr:MFS general substrate transporter [Guyanagaster necrorhizus MCA 3950]KAG7444819.1 MFS general substrate transporter [Guyanagaster necrorhizus MCA 3950]